LIQRTVEKRLIVAIKHTRVWLFDNDTCAYPFTVRQCDQMHTRQHQINKRSYVFNGTGPKRGPLKAASTKCPKKEHD
jgi:hypothetical protein